MVGWVFLAACRYHLERSDTQLTIHMQMAGHAEVEDEIQTRFLYVINKRLNAAEHQNGFTGSVRSGFANLSLPGQKVRPSRLWISPAQPLQILDH